MIRENIDEETRTSSYTIICDGSDCEESMPPCQVETMAIVTAASAGWLLQKPQQKFSGIALRDYCPRCRKKNE